MADRAKNHHKRKNTFKIIRAAVIVLVIAVICILGFKSDFVSSSSSSTKKNKGEYTTYTVKSGDYLSTIASKYGTTTQELMDLNDLASGTINPGQELKVPANSSNDQDSSSADSSSQGDSDN